jgi:hypothetical protein
MRDNEQGKRYGRRDPETKRIIEAFGFDRRRTAAGRRSPVGGDRGAPGVAVAAGG